MSNNYYAILNSGATDNFVTEDAPILSKEANHIPIKVTLPDNTKLLSSHKCKLPLTNVPAPADEGYILPGMKLCNASCEVTFNKDECVVKHHGKEITRGTKNQGNGLWYVPLKKDIASVPNQTNHHQKMNSAYHNATMAETLKFMHQCLFSPTVDTLCKAIDNNQLTGFPHLMSALVRKYLPDSEATTKGHMNCTRHGLPSTTKIRETKKDNAAEDFVPKQDEATEVKIFVGATIGDQNDGTIYTNQTGSMTDQSFHGKRYQFIVYEYRSKAILVRALRDLKDASMLEAFQDVYQYYLTSKGFKPKLNVMDNQCSKCIQDFIKFSQADIQLVNHDDHRVNAAKNLEESLGFRPEHNRSCMPHRLMVPISQTGTRHTQSPPSSTYQSKIISVCDSEFEKS
jgi:hypothetical protein